MGLFGNNSAQVPNGALNLSASGAPMMGTQQQVFGASPNMFNQQNAFGAQGGMGAAFAQGMGVPNQPVAPPSETEILIHLMNSNVPVEKWLAGQNFQNVVNMLSSMVTLCIHNYFKNAKFVADDDGNLKVDVTSLPTDVQTVSPENVLMDLQQVQGAAQQSVQQCQMTQQQIAAIANQSLMSSALGAAMNEGMFTKGMSAMGSGIRGFVTGGR
jgi:hypothetical protein